MSNSNTHPDLDAPRYEHDTARYALQREAHAIAGAAGSRLYLSRHHMSDDEYERAALLVEELRYCIGELHLHEAIEADVLQKLLSDRDAAHDEFDALMKSVEASRIRSFQGW